MKFPDLIIVWTEGKNLLLPDLLSRSLKTTTQDEHRLRTDEIPDCIKFLMTDKQNTQPIQCQYAVSKEYINTLTTNTTVESLHFPIYLKIESNYFKVYLENDIHVPVLYHEFKTKAQPLEKLQQNKTQQFKPQRSLLETYPIAQHTDVTLYTNKRDPFTQFTKNANYADLMNATKFSLPALDDHILKSTEIYNYFYTEQTQINDTLLCNAQQDLVIRQLLIWKHYKNHPPIPSLTIEANKGLLHYYQRLQDLSIDETNHFFISCKQPPHQKSVYHSLSFSQYFIWHTLTISQVIPDVKKAVPQ